MPSSSLNRSERPVARLFWGAAGLLAVAVGAIGVVVPGLPTTIFFIVAAWAFSKSSPRLEGWVLGLPRIGPMVADHRAGLGMPRRTKWTAMSMIVVFAGMSAWLIGRSVVQLAVLAVAAVGLAYIWFRVPTREDVISAESNGGPSN